MVRRGQQDKKAMREAQREAVEQLDSQQGGYIPPRRGDCNAKQWEMAYDDANTVRVQFNIWRLGGRIVEFVVNVQVLTSDGWETVEYFDCCHGHCHHHPRNAESPRTIQRLDGIDDVQEAFGVVEPLVEERVRIIRDEGA